MGSRLVFFGNERLATGLASATPLLRSLISNGYEICAVVVAQKYGSHASRSTRPVEVVEMAQSHNIPVLAPQKLSEIHDQLEAYGAQAGVLAAYGKLVPESIIELFPAGIINIHPSLLPLHRGSIPLEAAILDGDSRSGVSLMQLVKAMDAGPVYAQQSFALDGSESKQQLLDQLSAAGVDMLAESLPKILSGDLQPQAQDDSLATYDGRISKADGILGDDDWQRPAEYALRKIRAYAGWPRVQCILGDTKITVTGAHSEPGDGVPGCLVLERKKIGIQCQGDVLVIDSLIPAGKKEMSAASYLAGYKPAGS